MPVSESAGGCGQVVLELRERPEHVGVIVYLFVGVTEQLDALNGAQELPDLVVLACAERGLRGL